MNRHHPSLSHQALSGVLRMEAVITLEPLWRPRATSFIGRPGSLGPLRPQSQDRFPIADVGNVGGRMARPQAGPPNSSVTTLCLTRMRSHK